ncbi:MAG: uroporphyrinogen-III synthase [Cyanobacteria bacterium]|nr:uroporphyrinogen-III synthase [Cyanobacteriota bacterium]
MVPPLRDKTILVTRSAGQSSQFHDLLNAQGARVIDMPALEITPPTSWQPLDRAIVQLPQYDWLILTSANAVDYFWQRLTAVGNPAAINHIKLAVVGKKTAQALQAKGYHPDYIPPDFVADSLVAAFPEPVAGKALLFPRVESGGRAVLVQEMTAAGATVTEVPAYESACPARPDPTAIAALQTRQIDVITFASSKTVRHGCQLMAQGLGDRWREVIAPAAIASIGPQTSDACRACLGRVEIEADVYTLDGLTEAICQWASALLA